MIYLLDCPLDDTSHSRYIIDIIKEHSTVPIKLIPLNLPITIGQLCQTIYDLLPVVLPRDIVLCPWAVPANEQIDDLFTELSSLCYVVVAAGNFHAPIEDYSPARVPDVITVGTLNKSGLVAALSNYSNTKEVVWVPGTNYNVGWKNSSGTSVSAAVYTAFLSVSIQQDNMDMLQTLIENHKNKVFEELNSHSKA
jgi:hypothetical protein